MALQPIMLYKNVLFVRLFQERSACYDYSDNKIVVTNGFVKKTQRTPQTELVKAQKYKKDYNRGEEEDSMRKKRTRALCWLVLAALLCACFPAAAEEETDVLAGSVPFLVNKENPVGEDFVPADLVLLKDVLDASLVTLGDPELSAVRTAAEALSEMLAGAAEDGVKNWKINAAYRSIRQQDIILERKISSYLEKHPGRSRYQARSHVLTSVAEPGCSEHHLGLAIDITAKGVTAFKGTKQCKWLHAHCWDYGFIVRYQEGKEAITGFTAEEWHIRYVGVEHAKAMQASGQCLEEYLETLPPGEAAESTDMEVEEISLEDLGL